MNKLNGGSSLRTVDLAEEFNVTQRTVQRDMQLLNTSGFPLANDDNGYRFVENFSLQKIIITPEEKFLLDIFYNLFSKMGQPLNKTAKDFLNKVLVSDGEPETALKTDLTRKQKRMLKDEIQKLSKSIAAKMEDLTYPPEFRRKIDEVLENIQRKICNLSKRENIKIKFQRTNEYEQPNPVATISMPATYFDDPYLDLGFLKNKKNRIFEIKALLPNKFFKTFRKALKLNMHFNFWGPHLKPKQLTCFDDFASYLGFSNKQKEFNYTYSYANDKGNMITSGAVYWEDEIPMSKETLKPFLNKTGGLWVAGDYVKKKKT